MLQHWMRGPGPERATSRQTSENLNYDINSRVRAAETRRQNAACVPCLIQTGSRESNIQPHGVLQQISGKPITGNLHQLNDVGKLSIQLLLVTEPLAAVDGLFFGLPSGILSSFFC